MTNERELNSGIDSDQAEQMPALTDRSAAEVETIAELLVEVRALSTQLSTDELRHELRERLRRAGIQLPSTELEELISQLAPSDPEARP